MWILLNQLHLYVTFNKYLNTETNSHCNSTCFDTIVTYILKKILVIIPVIFRIIKWCSSLKRRYILLKKLARISTSKLALIDNIIKLIQIQVVYHKQFKELIVTDMEEEGSKAKMWFASWHELLMNFRRFSDWMLPILKSQNMFSYLFRRI